MVLLPLLCSVSHHHHSPPPAPAPTPGLHANRGLPFPPPTTIIVLEQESESRCCVVHLCCYSDRPGSRVPTPFPLPFDSLCSSSETDSAVPSSNSKPLSLQPFDSHLSIPSGYKSPRRRCANPPPSPSSHLPSSAADAPASLPRAAGGGARGTVTDRERARAGGAQHSTYTS